MDGLDKAGCQEKAPASSHHAREDGRPPRAWERPAGRAQARQRVDSAAGLQLNTLSTLGIFSGGSGSTAGFSGSTQGKSYELWAGDQHWDTPESGGLVTAHSDHDRNLGEEGNEDSVRETSEEAVRTVCEQVARNICEVLDTELCGGLQVALRKGLRGELQAALREEVGRAVREEFQSCSQELRELRPQRILVENGCQTDGTTVPVRLRPRHAKSEDHLTWPIRASCPQPKASSTPCLPGLPVIPDPLAHTVATASRGQKPSLPGPGDEASRGRWQTGADPREGADAKHPAHLSKKDSGELESLEQRGVLLPRGDAKGSSSSLRGKPHARPQDAVPPCRRGAHRAWTPAGEEGPGREEQTSVCSSEDAACIITSATETEAAHMDAGSEGRSTPQHGGRAKLEAGLQVSTAEMLRMQMDKELVSQFSLDCGDGELESVASTPPTAESGRCSWLVALPANISSLLGSRVAQACGVIPWDPAYPRASTLYQWIMVGLVGKCLYHSGSSTHKEWELGESSGAVVLALDTIMGTGALVGIVSCGALWRSTVIVDGCMLVKACAGKLGMMAHWEEVSATDFSCTVSFWLASVLTAVAEALYFEQSATAEDLLSHVGCFALFAFILMGMSQFAIHICRCITKMIDAFCHRITQQPDFTKALKEWSLLQSLCCTACARIQFAFMSLQVTAAAVVLMSTEEVGRHDASRLMALAPGLIVAMGVFRTSLWAAAVTDKCVRVPTLVNSVLVDDLLDQDRMYLVQYIAYSQAGFYVFDVRLTSLAVLKTVYIACALTFFLTTRVFVE